MYENDCESDGNQWICWRLKAWYHPCGIIVLILRGPLLQCWFIYFTQPFTICYHRIELRYCSVLIAICWFAANVQLRNVNHAWTFVLIMTAQYNTDYKAYISIPMHITLWMWPHVYWRLYPKHTLMVISSRVPISVEILKHSDPCWICSRP